MRNGCQGSLIGGAVFALALSLALFSSACSSGGSSAGHSSTGASAGTGANSGGALADPLRDGRRQRPSRCGQCRGARGRRRVPCASRRGGVPRSSGRLWLSRPAAERSGTSRSRLLGRVRVHELRVADLVHHLHLRGRRRRRHMAVREQQRLRAGDGRGPDPLLRAERRTPRCCRRRRGSGRAVHGGVPDVLGTVPGVARLAMLRRLHRRWPHRDQLHAERRRSVQQWRPAPLSVGVEAQGRT